MSWQFHGSRACPRLRTARRSTSAVAQARPARSPYRRHDRRTHGRDRREHGARICRRKSLQVPADDVVGGVDPSGLHVYGYALDGYVHKYDIGTGEEVFGPGRLALITPKDDVEKGSSNISIATARNHRSYLYMTIAAYPDPGDAGDYQGIS
jgi:hypothetical protein